MQRIFGSKPNTLYYQAYHNYKAEDDGGLVEVNLGFDATQGQHSYDIVWRDGSSGGTAEVLVDSKSVLMIRF